MTRFAALAAVALGLAVSAPVALAQESLPAAATTAASGELVEFQTLDTATGRINGYLYRPVAPAPKAPADIEVPAGLDPGPGTPSAAPPAGGDA